MKKKIYLKKSSFFKFTLKELFRFYFYIKFIFCSQVYLDTIHYACLREEPLNVVCVFLCVCDSYKKKNPVQCVGLVVYKEFLLSVLQNPGEKDTHCRRLSFKIFFFLKWFTLRSRHDSRN